MVWTAVAMCGKYVGYKTSILSLGDTTNLTRRVTLGKS